MFRKRKVGVVAAEKKGWHETEGKWPGANLGECLLSRPFQWETCLFHGLTPCLLTRIDQLDSLHWCLQGPFLKWGDPRLI